MLILVLLVLILNFSKLVNQLRCLQLVHGHTVLAFLVILGVGLIKLIVIKVGHVDFLIWVELLKLQIPFIQQSRPEFLEIVIVFKLFDLVRYLIIGLDQVSNFIQFALNLINKIRLFAPFYRLNEREQINIDLYCSIFFYSDDTCLLL